MDRSGHPRGEAENNNEDWEKMGARPKGSTSCRSICERTEETQQSLKTVCEHIEGPERDIVEPVLEQTENTGRYTVVQLREPVYQQTEVLPGPVYQQTEVLPGPVYQQIEGPERGKVVQICGPVCQETEAPGFDIIKGVEDFFLKKHSTDDDLVWFLPEMVYNTMSVIPSCCHEPNWSFCSTSVPNGENETLEGSRRWDRESNSPGRDSLEASDTSLLALDRHVSEGCALVERLEEVERRQRREREIRAAREREAWDREAASRSDLQEAIPGRAEPLCEPSQSHCEQFYPCHPEDTKTSHARRPDSGYDKCCVCLEDAFSGRQILPCSHTVHRECAIAIQNGITICRRCLQRLFDHPDCE